jgi:Putative Flp pilus-assembly TadE/G-like
MTRRLRGRWRPSFAGEGGQITVFVVVMTAALILVAGLVLDGGLTLAARERALDEAQQAARAGAQAINLATYRQNGTLVLDPAQAVADARRYLAATGYQGSVQVVGNVVTVVVTVTQQMQILDAAGLGSITVHASASATPERGITGVIP